MLRTVLVTTSSDGLQPLGSAAQRSYELVSGVLRSRLGADHAALFAEPVASAHGDRIDWHAPMPGRAQPLADLPETTAQQVRAQLAKRVGEIRAEAERLAQSGGPEAQRLSEALVNALEVPGEDMIWAVHGEDGRISPVLVHWAWLRNDRRQVHGVLTGMVPRPPDSVAQPVAAAGSPAGLGWLIGLGWLALAAMLAAILWLLLAPCGLMPLGPDHCPGEDPLLAAAFGEQDITADEIAALERGLALAARRCQPTVPIVPAPDRRGDAGGGIRLAANEKRVFPGAIPAINTDRTLWRASVAGATANRGMSR